MQVVVMRVSLHCQGCAGKVKKHLSKMEGNQLKNDWLDYCLFSIQKSVIIMLKSVYCALINTFIFIFESRMPLEEENNLTGVWYPFKIMFFVFPFLKKIKTGTKLCLISYFLKLVFRNDFSKHPVCKNIKNSFQLSLLVFSEHLKHHYLKTQTEKNFPRH